jgi:hypothetical protein
LHYAIRNGLLGHFRPLPEPRPRVGHEYDDITNVDFSPTPNHHPVDLVILHPLVQAAAPNTYSGYAWAPENSAALGLIEVKKERRFAAGDAEWLDGVCQLPPVIGMRRLEWVLLVVFLAGPTSEAVIHLGQTTGQRLEPWGMRTLTQSAPTEAPSHPGSIGVVDRWFDVMCYGKECAINA